MRQRAARSSSSRQPRRAASALLSATTAAAAAGGAGSERNAQAGGAAALSAALHPAHAAPRRAAHLLLRQHQLAHDGAPQVVRHDRARVRGDVAEHQVADRARLVARHALTQRADALHGGVHRPAARGAVRPRGVTCCAAVAVGAALPAVLWLCWRCVRGLQLACTQARTLPAMHPRVTHPCVTHHSSLITHHSSHVTLELT
jgi:hypothetical protein